MQSKENKTEKKKKEYKGWEKKTQTKDYLPSIQ